MFLRSILIAAVAVACLASIAAAKLDDQMLPNVLSLPFNDLLPPLFESVSSSSDERAAAAALTTIAPLTVSTTAASTTPKPGKVATTRATATTTRKPTIIDKSKENKIVAKATSAPAAAAQPKPQTEALALALPFNDLLPPLLLPIDNNDAPSAETRISTTILSSTIKPKLVPAKISPKLTKQAILGQPKVKPSIFTKTDPSQKYFKKPIPTQKTYANAKYSSNSDQYATQLQPQTVRQYIEHFHHTTYRPPKANLPTLTPFPRHL